MSLLTLWTGVTLYPYYISFARGADNCFPLSSWGAFHTNHDGGIILHHKLIRSSPGGFFVRFRPETAKEHRRSEFVVSHRMEKQKEESNKNIILPPVNNFVDKCNEMCPACEYHQAALYRS